ncbi:MAG TPA: MOSC domain-containing protein [Solirubrobacteraceae bacterium]|nr:MOSC domain-containing protein [Solirubrobacteraceae bacterium]
MPAVTGLAVTAVKATRLRQVDQVELGPDGVRENRRFYLIDDRNQLVNSKRVGQLQQVIADYSDAERRLRLELPDGQVVEDEVRHGGLITTKFFSRAATGQLVDGPWSAALSDCLGRPLRLVEAGDTAVDRGSDGAVSLISRASLERLGDARDGDWGEIDVRRFRMLIEIDGVEAHAEDRWVGREVRVGEARVAFGGHVGRCVITTRDPDTGVVDFPTLKMLGSYRLDLDTTEPLAFGIHGRVLEPGAVRLGDVVTLEDSVRRP